LDDPNRLRITAQLIDAPTEIYLWAERFDGGLEDIFDLQDQVTPRVVGEIAPKLEQAEIERAKRKPTDCATALANGSDPARAFGPIPGGRPTLS
jgi:hypothetical protein